MKRAIIILGCFLLLFFFILSSVSGVIVPATCNANQVILKLSNYTNAHGEIWSTGSYPFNICYDVLFGNSYNPGAAAGANQQCTGTNKVLRLSGQTNAHAEVPSASTTNYIDVCYGNLACQGRSGNCLGGETEVVTLSSATNAHLEDDAANSFTGSGVQKICCSPLTSPPAGGIQEVMWQNIYGQNITSSAVNSTIVMYAQTTFPQGTVVTFDAYEEDGPFGDDFIAQLTLTTDANGIARVTVPITDAIMAAGITNDIFSEGDELEFYFVATAQGESNQSYNLYVDIAQGPNQPPVATITSPGHRQIYFTGTQLSFNQISLDPENQQIAFNWTIIHNEAVEFTSNSPNFYHTFLTDGMRTITLRVTDLQGAFYEAQIAIVVISSPGMIAYVNKPFHREVVTNPGNPPGTIFNASDSYVVNSEGDFACPVVSCIAGNCPAYTNNTPVSCTGQTELLVSGTPQPFNSLFFNWSFGQGNNQLSNFGGLGNVSGYYSYTSPSGSRDDKWIKLNLSYNGAFSIFEKTQRVFTLGQCINGRTQFIQTDPNGNFLYTISTLNSGYACSGGDNAINGNECCPTGFACSLASSSSSGGCVGSPNNIIKCEDYTGQNDCENDLFNVGDVNNSIYASLVYSCTSTGGAANLYCAWNNTNNQCDPKLDCVSPVCVGPNCGPTGGCTQFTCSYTSQQSQCLAGYLTVNYSASLLPGTCVGSPPPNSCSRPPVTIPCGRFNLELGFFSYWNLISAIAIIAVSYFVIWKRKNE